MHKNDVEMVLPMSTIKSQKFFAAVSAKVFAWRKGGPVLKGPQQLQFLLTSLGAGGAAPEGKGFVLVTVVWYTLGEVSLEPVESYMYKTRTSFVLTEVFKTACCILFMKRWSLYYLGWSVILWKIKVENT